jgi:uncharacterized protein
MASPIGKRFAATGRKWPTIAVTGVLVIGGLFLALGGAGHRPESDPKEETSKKPDRTAVHGDLPRPSRAAIPDLPSDGGDEFNRLIFESSPYLLQHARNPVDWYPWGDAAFEKAQREDKPIFLSIGYSTCHWCHVMERESFEDDEVARLMNAHFVAIKVDREERPDIDQLYMTVTQALTGSGGWPMTVILTPDKKPFFAGTYFPKHGRGQRPGLMDLLPQLQTTWETRRGEVESSAEQIVAAVRDRSGSTPGPDLDAGILDIAYSQLSSRFDSAYGGFGQAPKFPTPQNLRFLLRYHDRHHDPRALEMAVETLEAMRLGGMYDQVGFGFHRYSTDREWLLPHFEKMLYDQALLVLAYTEAYQVTGRDLFRRTADEVIAFVLKEMTSPDGGFYSAFDADSEGEEGLFYLWTTDEIKAVLDGSDAELVIEVFGVVEGGNFLDQATGKKTGGSILHLERSVEEIARAKGMPVEELRARLERCRRELYRARQLRIPPLLDDKVLTDWNGLMISALAYAGQTFGEEDYVEAADDAAAFIRSHLVGSDGRLLKRFRAGDAALPATLEDHAFLIGGLLDLYEATFEVEHLRWAIDLAGQMVEHYEDDARGGFFLGADDGEDLFMRVKEVYDGAIPSGNSAAVLVLARLARLTGDMSHEDAAWRTLRAFAGDVSGAPSAHCHLLLGLDFLIGPAFEVVLAGKPESDGIQDMLSALRTPFMPNKVVLMRSSEPQDPITEIAGYTAYQTALEGKATV